MAGKKVGDGATAVLFTRADAALVRAVNAEWKRRTKDAQGMKLSRADVVRALLWEALKKGQAT